MNFDFVIGTPLYNDTRTQSGNTYAPSVYHFFMNAAFNIATKAELITPARFLFRAGDTPKEWNEKMLNNPHLKVLKYVEKSVLFFPETNIAGGVAICYYDINKNFGKVGLFTPNLILSELAHKVSAYHEFVSISECIYSPYTFTELIHQEQTEIAKRHPELQNRYVLATNIFTKLEGIVFFKQKPNDQHDYVQIYGILKNQRQYMWVKKKYIKTKQNWNKYKVMIPVVYGSGQTSKQIIGKPTIGDPMVGYTSSFISIGAFDSKTEAENCFKYIKSRFARALVSVLKITQDNRKSVWFYVPQQDFSNNSDIKWDCAIEEIDEQLYKKYKLTDNEINFIQTNIKAMP